MEVYSNAERHVRRRSLIIMFTLLLIPLMFYRSHAGSDLFGAAIPCGTKAEARICTTRALQAGRRIILMDLSGNTYCPANLGEQLQFEHPYKDIFVNPLSISGCRNDNVSKMDSIRRNEYLIYLGSSIDTYRNIELKAISDGSLIDNVDTIIRKQGLLTKAIKDYFSGSLSAKPILFQVPPLSRNIALIQYVTRSPRRQGMLYGPLYIKIKNKVKMLDDQATIVGAFELNDKYYILYNHGCWQGCGDIYQSLIEIYDGSYKRLFVDDTLGT